MKITVNVDCTPEEARASLGLPDVRPMQDAMMRDIQERMAAGLAAMDADTLMKTWLPGLPGGGQGGQGWEQLQKMFWSSFPMGGSREKE